MTAPIIEGVNIVQVLGEGAGQVQALKGVSIALAGGELTLLMGPVRQRPSPRCCRCSDAC